MFAIFTSPIPRYLFIFLFIYISLWIYSPMRPMNSATELMAPSPRHSGVRRIPGLPDSSADVRVDTSVSSNGSTHETSPTNDASCFTIHYTNIRGLSSNFASVDHHLTSSLPNLLLLSETQLSSDTSSDPYCVSNYILHPRFRFKGGVCAYININTPAARRMDLESPNFDVI